MEDSAELWRDVVKMLLKPLVRFCVFRRQTAQDFMDAAKEVFVEVAIEEIERTGKRVNVSRISVITGLRRRLIDQYWREQRPIERQAENLLPNVVGQWEQDKRFCTKDNRPKNLSYRGENNEFAELVQLINKSINPGTVLFELERIGMVKRTPKGLKLVQRVQRWKRDPRKGFSLLAQDIQAMLAGIGENILSEEGGINLHIHTEYDNVFKSEIPQIREWLKNEGKKFHKRARDYVSQFDMDINSRSGEAGGGKVIVTSFSSTAGSRDQG